MSNFETLTSGGGWRGGDIWCTETGTRCTTRRGGEGVSVCQVTALLKCGPSASPRVGSWHRTNGRLRVAVRGEGDQTWLPAACSLRRQAGPTAQMVERPVPVWLRAWDTPLSVYHQLGTHAHRHQEPTIHDCGRQDPDACDFPLLTPPPPPPDPSYSPRHLRKLPPYLASSCLHSPNSCSMTTRSARRRWTSSSRARFCCSSRLMFSSRLRIAWL